jgi:hypothetical protein
MNAVRARWLILSLLLIVVMGCGGNASIATPAPSSSTGAPSPTLASPRVVSAAGSEAVLTVTYDRPMKHGLACGTQGFVAGPANTIDALEMNITTRYYTSPDADFDELLSAMWVASLNADCSAVTFTFVHGIAPGTYPLRITKVQDQAGRPLASDPMTVVATMLEGSAPRMQLVQQWEDHALLEFSEPIKKALAEDVTRYRFDGAALPAGSTAACRIASCAVVEITLPTPRARPPKTVTVAGLEDLAGKPFAAGTETRDIDLMQGQ